jgi:hypothetical protein
MWRLSRESPGDVWRISVKPSDGPDIAALTQGEAVFDWGGGLIWAAVPEGTDLRARLGAFAGHATLVRASEDTRARIAPFQPEAAPIAALSEGLAQAVRPQGHPEPWPDGGLRSPEADAVASPSCRASVRRGVRWPVALVRRPRGASIAQAVLVVGAVLVFVAIAVPGGIAGLPPERIAGFGVGLMSAAVAGMLYHLYLGRFDQVWTARGVFLLVYLVVSALFGLIFLSLI